MFLILKNWYNKNELKCILILKNICPATNCTLISHLQAALLAHVTMNNSDSSATQTSKRGLPWIAGQKAPLQHLLQLQPFLSGEKSVWPRRYAHPKPIPPSSRLPLGSGDPRIPFPNFPQTATRTSMIFFRRSVLQSPDCTARMHSPSAKGWIETG